MCKYSIFRRNDRQRHQVKYSELSKQLEDTRLRGTSTYNHQYFDSPFEKEKYYACFPKHTGNTVIKNLLYATLNLGAKIVR